MAPEITNGLLTLQTAVANSGQYAMPLKVFRTTSIRSNTVYSN